MLSLADIRDYIAGLGIVKDDHVYMGKLDNKQQQTIGVYSRKTDGPPQTAIGGMEATTHELKPVSILIHWTASPRESEKAAFMLFDRLRNETNVMIGDKQIDVISFRVPEPQDVGTDECGVYEYVIWLDFIYVREAPSKLLNWERRT